MGTECLTATCCRRHPRSLCRVGARAPPPRPVTDLLGKPDFSHSRRTEGLNTTLVCMLGSVRGTPESWRTQLEKMLWPLAADLALLLPFGSLAPKVLAEHAAFIWRVREYRDWSQLIAAFLGNDWQRNASLDDNRWGGLRLATGRLLHGSGAILAALRATLLTQLDSILDPPYTTVVVTRYDHYHSCNHPAIQPLPTEVHVPLLMDNGGLSDRHALFAFASRRMVLAVLPWAARERHCASCGNFEQVLSTYFEAVGVETRRFKRTFFTVWANRTERSRWGLPQCILPLDVAGSREVPLWSKYPQEVVEAVQTCRGSRKNHWEDNRDETCLRPSVWKRRYAA